MGFDEFQGLGFLAPPHQEVDIALIEAGGVNWKSKFGVVVEEARPVLIDNCDGLPILRERYRFACCCVEIRQSGVDFPELRGIVALQREGLLKRALCQPRVAPSSGDSRSVDD